MTILRSEGALPPKLPERREDFLEQALRISERRLTVLASNIANADTPNYKARDLDFRQALQNAMNNRSSTVQPVMTPNLPLKENPLAQALMYRIPSQGAVDGNTVEVDKEMAEFTAQAIRHQVLLTRVMDEFKEFESIFKNSP